MIQELERSRIMYGLHGDHIQSWEERATEEGYKIPEILEARSTCKVKNGRSGKYTFKMKYNSLVMLSQAELHVEKNFVGCLLNKID